MNVDCSPDQGTVLEVSFYVKQDAVSHTGGGHNRREGRQDFYSGMCIELEGTQPFSFWGVHSQGPHGRESLMRNYPFLTPFCDVRFLMCKVFKLMNITVLLAI